MNLSELKARYTIFDIAEKYNLKVNRHNMCICPIHNDVNASMKLNASNNTFYCFGCGEKGDIFDLVCKIEKCNITKACEIIAGCHFSTIKHTEKPKTIADDFNCKDFLISCMRDLKLTRYFYRRGLTCETQYKFLLGYDKKHSSVTIPYNRRLNYYQSRSTVDKKFYKPNVAKCGKEPLFNGDALGYYDYVFVVESPICAMSIDQCGHPAIATCGVQNWRKIQPSKTKLLIAFDNDAAGQDGAIKLKNAVGGEIVNVADECKDPNELLVKDCERLKKNLDKIVKKYV